MVENVTMDSNILLTVEPLLLGPLSFGLLDEVLLTLFEGGQKTEIDACFFIDHSVSNDLC